MWPVAISRLVDTRTQKHCRIQRGTRYPLLFRVSLLHLDPGPTVRVGRNRVLNPNLFNGPPSWAQRPRSRWLSLRIRVHVQRHPPEGLDEASDYCRHFVVCELLSEADPGSGVEWKEDEGVRDEVLLDSFIQEPFRVELFRCRELRLLMSHGDRECYERELTIGTPEILSPMH